LSANRETYLPTDEARNVMIGTSGLEPAPPHVLCMVEGGRGRGMLRMAVSTCGKCGGERFELADAELPGGAARFMLVQCSDCGVAIGVFDPDGRDQVEGLRRQIASIDLRLMQIAKVLASLN